MKNTIKLSDYWGLAPSLVEGVMREFGYDIKEYNRQDDYMDIDSDLSYVLEDLTIIQMEESARDPNSEEYEFWKDVVEGFAPIILELYEKYKEK